MPEGKASEPSYGVIEEYIGEKGREYFRWQGRSGPEQAQYNRHIWESRISPTDDILDFGCGGGFLLSVLDAQRKAWVEINPHARETATSLGLEVFERLDEVPGTFDKVISSHALEHVPNPRQAVLELKDKLRDERSRMILLLPLDDWRSRANRNFDPSDVNMHLYAWTPQLIGNLLKSCDLDVLEVRVIRHAWPPASARLWRASKKAFHAAAFMWSVLNRQRQLLAVASLKKSI